MKIIFSILILLFSTSISYSKNTDKEKKYSESVFLNRSTGELIHEVTKNMNTKDNEKYISFFGCIKEL